MNEICRICLEKCTKLNQRIENYADVMEKVCQIKLIIDPSLPEMICDVCLNGLLEADLLRDMCLKSHDVCMKIINNDDQKSMESEVDEAYGTESCDSDFDSVYRKGARCCICDEIFESVEVLLQHCLLTHSIELYEDPKDNQCIVCGVQYDILEQLSTHISIFSPLGTEDSVKRPLELRTPKYKRNEKKFRGKYKPGIAYKCHICSKTVRGYETHLKSEHPNTPIEFRCHICPRVYSVMNSLISHVHNIHGDSHKFRCDICDKIFARNALMQQHREATHFNVRKFECDFCHLKFARKQHLAVHARTHLKYRPLKCKLCKLEFMGQVELNDHIFRHVYGNDMPFL